MSVPIYLFEEVISNSGTTDIYYYNNSKFFRHRDFLENKCGDLVRFEGKEINYDEFNEAYKSMKEVYCLDEELINGCIREYQIKNLLES